MATKTLTIEGDRAHFLLALDAGTVRVGDGPAHTAGLLRDLRVVRVRCEVEVEDDRDQLPVEEPGVLTRRAIRPGDTLRLGHAVLSLAGPPPAAAPDADTVTTEPLPTAAGPRRLKVIDGGDQGQTFRLPDAGTVTVGKADGPAGVGLHDFYVARVHCSLAVGPDGVTVTHLDGPNGTLIDGRPVAGPQPLKPGAVLRVGNSHLRLEFAPGDDAPDGGPKSRVLRPSARPTPQPVEADAEPDEPPPPEPEARAVGPYRLGRSLGRGFYGEVFEATHDQTGQVVALKLLAPEFPAGPAELERFVRELKQAQAVRHPNLLGLVGAGRTPAGCWVAREYVAGESAAAVVARIAAGEKPSWTRAARAAVHLARALDALHRHHLFHGNVTPANVLLRADDHAAKLADFRLAQAVNGSGLQKAVLEAKLLAELPYLAPEQANPDAFVDALADLYAVGAVVYALLTGRPPVEGSDPTEILENIQAGRVVRPSAVYRRVPPAFDAVVMKLLATHQEDRYPTAAALLADLAPVVEDHGVTVG